MTQVGEDVVVIQASVAVYPLQQATNAAIEGAIAALCDAGLECEVRPMHTEVLGPAATVFAALQRAFEAASILGPTVMTITISNACPLPPRRD